MQQTQRHPRKTGAGKGENAQRLRIDDSSIRSAHATRELC